jgi:hypothetical protein
MDNFKTIQTELQRIICPDIKFDIDASWVNKATTKQTEQFKMYLEVEKLLKSGGLI